MAPRRQVKVQTVGALASIDDGPADASAAQPQAIARSMQKAMAASDRRRAQMRHRKRIALPTTETARWINGWTPERRLRLQPQAAEVKPPADEPRQRRRGTADSRAGHSRRMNSSAEGSRLGDWFEVGSSRAHSGSMPSWYTAALDAGPVSADGRIRMAAFHRPSPSPSDLHSWVRPATAAGPPRADTELSASAADRPKSVGDVPVSRELSGGISGTLDETGSWRPRTPGDDVFTPTVAAVSGVQARGAATTIEERPLSPASLRPRRQPSPLRKRRPPSAVLVAKGQAQPEVLEWLAVAQLDSERLEEAEGLLAKKRSEERPQSAGTNRRAAGTPVPVAIVEPECVVHAQEQSGLARDSPPSLGAAVKRAAPRRPWTREESAAQSVSQHAESLSLSGGGARAHAEQAAVSNSIIARQRAAAEADRRRRQSGVSADGVRVVRVPRRSYDNGVGYKSLLRPAERADGRPTWGLLEWPAELSNVLGIGDRTTWGS